MLIIIVKHWTVWVCVCECVCVKHGFKHTKNCHNSIRMKWIRRVYNNIYTDTDTHTLALSSDDDALYLHSRVCYIYVRVLTLTLYKYRICVWFCRNVNTVLQHRTHCECVWVWSTIYSSFFAFCLPFFRWFVGWLVGWLFQMSQNIFDFSTFYFSLYLYPYLSLRVYFASCRFSVDRRHHYHPSRLLLVCLLRWFYL